MTPTDLYDDRFDFRGLARVKIWVFFLFREEMVCWGLGFVFVDGMGLAWYFQFFFSYSEVLTSSWIVWFAKTYGLLLEFDQMIEEAFEDAHSASTYFLW